MNVTTTAPRSWSGVKWMLALLLVFAAHIVFVYAFGSRVQPLPREAVLPFTIRFTTAFGDWQELNDPTLFARPHPRGFAGATWMKRPPIALPAFHWNEPSRSLALDTSKLGEGFGESIRNKNDPAVQFAALPSPEVPGLDLRISDLNVSRPFSLRTGGPLAGRRLINVPQPAAINSADLLTNTVVQVLVDTNGFVFSPTLLPPGSGSLAADNKALELAWTLRFESPSNKTAWTVGTLIFEWQTAAMQENGATNAPPKNP